MGDIFETMPTIQTYGEALEEELLGQLLKARLLLLAIDEGGLFADAPSSGESRERHEAGCHIIDAVRVGVEDAITLARIISSQ